jgi:hypothetical protein
LTDLFAFIVILNSFQDPSCPARHASRDEGWTLKRVQDDEKGDGVLI